MIGHAIKKLKQIFSSEEVVCFHEAMKRAATYSEIKVQSQADELKEYEMEYECSSNEVEEYYGQHMFSTELAGVQSQMLEQKDK